MKPETEPKTVFFSKTEPKSYFENRTCLLM